MKRYLALSRTTHGILDLASPAFCAVLWLGMFPPVPTILLGALTAFAAYTSVYALNDLVGMTHDREKFAGTGINPGYSVEASALRYPLAQSVLNRRQAWLWMGGWFALALIGAYLLNPISALILIVASALEVLYCNLLKVTYWRVLVSGLVKTSGPMAAIFAVDRAPEPLLMLIPFAWMFFWEIGGQNIPADWNDTEEDRRVDARTIPVQFGFKTAGVLVMAGLLLAVVMSAFLPQASPAPLRTAFAAAAVLVGIFMLLRPAYRLFRFHEGRQAARLFDSASYYPLSMLVLISAFLIAQKLFPS